MNSALLKNNLAAIVADSQTRKVLSRSGLIAGLCISSIVSSYAIPSGVDATKANNESVMITQQSKKVSGVVTDSAGEPIPGANVVQKGTTNGTSTDMDGKYTPWMFLIMQHWLFLLSVIQRKKLRLVASLC